MRGHESAYAVLGLRPGAPRAEIDSAYRRLMKRYHPDRPGGDSGRASEINHAYSQLRKLSPEAAAAARPQTQTNKPKVKWTVPIQPPPRPRRRSRKPLLVLFLVGLTGVAMQAGWAMRASWPDFLETDGLGGSSDAPWRASFRPPEALQAPVNAKVVDQAVSDAVQFYASGDRELVDGFSQICFAKLREEPTVGRFDTCTAYDEAVAILQGVNGDFDSGPFGATALTARQFAAARLLSDDYLAADSRLQQIRSRVEMTLLPRISEAGLVSRVPLNRPHQVREE